MPLPESNQPTDRSEVRLDISQSIKDNRLVLTGSFTYFAGGREWRSSIRGEGKDAAEAAANAAGKLNPHFRAMLMARMAAQPKPEAGADSPFSVAAGAPASSPQSAKPAAPRGIPHIPSVPMEPQQPPAPPAAPASPSPTAEPKPLTESSAPSPSQPSIPGGEPAEKPSSTPEAEVFAPTYENFKARGVEMPRPTHIQRMNREQLAELIHYLQGVPGSVFDVRIDGTNTQIRQRIMAKLWPKPPAEPEIP